MAVAVIVFSALLTEQASSQDAAHLPAIRPPLSFYGPPGVIDMPSAVMQPDGQASVNIAARDGFWRTTLGFQFAPWLYASYQYSFTKGLVGVDGSGDLYDRGFNLALRLMEEGEIWPSLVLGLNDIAGTGVFASEYLVASKTIQNRFRLTAGIGWGRLGSYNGFNNPLSQLSDSFKEREADTGQGGDFNAGDWFGGPAAFFGGIEWQASEKLTLSAEYSSDAYEREEANTDFEHRSPFNFGLNYRLRPGIDLGLYSLYGSELGIRLSFSANPKSPPFRGGREPAPPPVAVRGNGNVDLAAWGLPSDKLAGRDPTEIRERVDAAFRSQGLELEGFELGATSVRVGFRNKTYDSVPQAIGRASRVLAAILPEAVESFELQPVEFGRPMSLVTVERSDLERLEFAPDRVWSSYVRADIEDAGDAPGFAEFASQAYPDGNFEVRPYIATVFFDPDAPVRADIGLDFGAQYSPTPGLVFSGIYRAKLAGNRAESTRDSTSVLPRVRSDLNLYDKEGSSYLSHLTAEYFFRPGANLFGRTTIGYLERMYGGASAELLWNPISGPLALGVDVNYARQRDFDGGLGFQDYDVITGHASAYYDFGEGYFAQVDAGRYLAEDWGATLTISRDFANGVRVGAFATRTDVSFEDFGEGSFDKGIFFEIPFSWLGGEPSRAGYSSVLRPVLRDGGARLVVRNRLHDVVKDYRDPELRQRWAGFWR